MRISVWRSVAAIVVVHQLYVVTQASLAEVTEWYRTALTTGRSSSPRSA